ncbi:BREX-1 system phosphatase PglZ type A [Kamptonema sp. UHCC 0994]|uniref:BREX-1 system phosphatase PglZ type A n=1 Tax=Kamptonema sp. UHCC 0994 TaxID=3031329 RepID=UPI0023B8BEC5|nr:BREX-1 system phosphatase PglZ type A [Kamptonema sp. UHCC 0994]MDF0553363.1 BREX-1 system phosphatase PglZ type A [Kamptonema sp. UHCC 0994]
MNTTRIQSSILTLFQDDNRWSHPGRRVVFWYDSDGQFTDAFNELQLDGIKKLQLGDTPFTVKHHLFIEQPEQPFLLYAPFPEPPNQDNWLLDIQLSGLTFSADPAALIFADLSLKQRSLEITIRERLKFFNSRKRTEALQNMALPPDTDERGLFLAMLSVVTGLKVPDAGAMIRQVLLKGLLESDNLLWKDIERFVKPQDFWQIVQEHTGFADTTPSLRKLFIQLLITHFEKSLQGSIPDSLKAQVITSGQRAYAFIDQWMRDQQDSPGWKELSQQIAEELNILDAIQNLSPEVLYETATFEVVDQAIIRACVKALRSPTPDLTPWPNWLQARRTLFWFFKYEPFYCALDAAIELLELKRQYPEGFRMPAPQLFQAYAKQLYRFDQTYRQFIVASDAAFGDILKELIDDIENLYTQWYLDELGEAWSDSLENSWELADIPSQTNFFGRHVQPIISGKDREKKAFVIISDALRYEVASELAEAIQKELRGKTTIEPLFGVLPSITKLGMAALLPGMKLELLPGNNDVLRDGLSTQGTAARQKVLDQNSRVEATILSAQDLLTMSSEKGRAAISAYRLVYIYHNNIDAIGDKAASEHQVFAACSDTIKELVRLVKKICNSLNGTNVLITSDHGFLYQRRLIAEADKRPLLRGEGVLETSRRYVLGRNLEADSGTKAFNLPYDTGGAIAIVPRGSLRFAVQGAGSQYVHGGASLQEICIPAIAYHHQRAVKGDEGPARKVGVQVNARARRVTNNRFSLSLVQTEAVEGRWRSRQVTVALYDPESLAPITDVRGAELSSSSVSPSDREFSIRLTVTTTNPPTTAYLIVKDADDESEILRETWTVNLGITNDFGDF